MTDKLAPSGKKCTGCGGDIPIGRVQIYPNTTVCTSCSTTGKVKGHAMITGKTTYSEVQIIDEETAERLNELGRRQGYNSRHLTKDRDFGAKREEEKE